MNQRGFLMAEVLIGFFLLTVMGAMVVMCTQSIRLMDASAHRTVAAFLAQKQLACIKGNPAVITAPGDIIWLDTSEQMPIVKNGISYMVVTTASEREASQRRVVVAVQWREMGGDRELRIPVIVATDE